MTNKLIILCEDDLAEAMLDIECTHEEEDLYWSKEGNKHSLYSQGQEDYCRPLAVIEVSASN